MHLYLTALSLLTFLLCGLFTSDEHCNVVSASPSCDYKINVVGLFNVIKFLLEDKKKGSDLILANMQNIENSLADVQTSIFKMKMKESRRCSILALKPEQKQSKNCAEIKKNENSTSGVRTVFPYGNSTVCHTTYIDVLCDQKTDEGGWTVIHSRFPLPKRENFSRSWIEYVEGFGDLNGEFWLGLENIHVLTTSAPIVLRIDLEDWEGGKFWAKYQIFQVGDAASKYALSIGNYSGNAHDGFSHVNNGGWNLTGMKFTTIDQDNDLHTNANCAKEFGGGGWWFNWCHGVNLNGLPHEGKHRSYFDGINWELLRGKNYSFKKASMKIRPV